MISFKNVSKTFYTKKGEIKALDDISLEIKPGEIFGIIGYSGAGKSTLVRCINLLEKPTGGTVTVADKELAKLTTAELRKSRKKIGMIFQHFNLMPSRTATGNVMLPLRGERLTGADKIKKIEALLDLVGLLDRKDAYPSALSGGQKQRVAIARALANDPDILLCDEATSSLDPHTTKSILRLLKEVNIKLGITIVIITHEMAVIKEICDRVAVMEQGQIKEMGDVLEVFANPQSNIAKEFISSATTIDKIYELIRNDADLVRLKPDEKLLKLTYSSSNTREPLIYEMSRQFELKTNIFFANVEIIKDQAVGTLAVIVQGEEKNIESGIKFLRNEIKVEIIETRRQA